MLHNIYYITFIPKNAQNPGQFTKYFFAKLFFRVIKEYSVDINEQNPSYLYEKLYE